MQDLLKNIPEELKLNALWCCWKYIENEDGDIVKKPFNVLTGYGAKSNNKSTFVSYPTMCRYLDNYLSFENNKQLGGAGLGIFNGYSAIDIDHCVDENGKISELANTLIEYCGSYTEYSPSRTGIRIIFKSSVKFDKNKYYINNAKLGLEIYISDHTSKFVSITGNKIHFDDIRTVDLTPMLEKYMKREIPLYNGVSVGTFDNNITISLNEALGKDDKLYDLWNSSAPGSHSNESEMDMALACKLAFYCNGDFNQTMNAFVSSPYYASKDDKHKNKWNNTMYGNNTIAGAISWTGTHVIQKPIIPNFKEPEPVKEQPLIQPKTYALTDVGNAHRFADTFLNDIHYNFDNEKWMIWNGKYWEYDVKDKIRDKIDLLALQMFEELKQEQNDVTRKLIAGNINKIQNNSGKKALLEECQHIGIIPVLNEDFDKDPYLICAPNMVYNLKTGEKLPHDREYLISQTLSCDIDLDHEPHRYLEFLDQIFEGDQEMINYCRKVWAYCLSGSTREQQMWIFFGDGNNGKSLALDILNILMGSYAVTSRPELLVDSKNANTSQEEIARLKGKRAAFMEEIKDGDRMNESLVKGMTSGIGKMTGRFLYGNTFEFTMIAKILMASNYKPKIKGIDKGIWRRVNLVPLYKDFTNVADKDLRDKLLEELPQIAGWLVKGFALYLKEGLDNKPQKVINETREYKEESDIVQQWINENCELDSKAHENASVLFKDFDLWCRDNKEYPMTQTSFGRNMGKKFKRLTYSNGKYYVGIKMRERAIDNEKKIAYDLTNIDEKDI